MKVQAGRMALLAALLLAGCAGGVPDIELNQTELDLGPVVNGEIREFEVEVLNQGQADLIVEGVSTSCGCTSAEVTPSNIPAGERAILSVRFDSGAHGPEEVGLVMRQVFVASNDPDEPEVEMRFTALIESPAP